MKIIQMDTTEIDNLFTQPSGNTQWKEGLTHPREKSHSAFL